MRLRHYLTWLLLLPGLLLLGCGQGGAKPVKVSGKVTMNKQPLANATVTFTPTNPDPNIKPIPESIGTTDAQGNYSLKLIKDQREGAVVGDHKVRISLFDRTSGKGDQIPHEYNKDSKLSFTVPAGGTSEANFDLKGTLGGARE